MMPGRRTGFGPRVVKSVLPRPPQCAPCYAARPPHEVASTPRPPDPQTTAPSPRHLPHPEAAAAPPRLRLREGGPHLRTMTRAHVVVGEQDFEFVVEREKGL